MWLVEAVIHTKRRLIARNNRKDDPFPDKDFSLACNARFGDIDLIKFLIDKRW